MMIIMMMLLLIAFLNKTSNQFYQYWTFHLLSPHKQPLPMIKSPQQKTLCYNWYNPTGFRFKILGVLKQLLYDLENKDPEINISDKIIDLGSLTQWTTKKY